MTGQLVDAVLAACALERRTRLLDVQPHRCFRRRRLLSPHVGHSSGGGSSSSSSGGSGNAATTVSGAVPVSGFAAARSVIEESVFRRELEDYC